MTILDRILGFFLKEMVKIAIFDPFWQPQSTLIISVSGLPRLPPLYWSKPGVKIQLVLVSFVPKGGGGPLSLKKTGFSEVAHLCTPQKTDFFRVSATEFRFIVRLNTCSTPFFSFCPENTFKPDEKNSMSI